ncbi:MAG: ECF-type sigma factor [Planctomycetota bacterium]
MAEIYEDLRSAAHQLMGDERRDHTLDATGLVNEAYVRLAEGGKREWNDSAHFRATVARMLRRILVDHARGRRRDKRGGGQQRVTLATHLLADLRRDVDVLELHEALARLEQNEPRAAQVVELRYFASMTIEQVAHHLNVGSATIERDWRFARAWLYSELFAEDPRLDDAASL